MLKGYIVNKFYKTAVIQIRKIKKHRKYKKYLHIFVKYIVHDSTNVSNIGDFVEVKQCRPYSKTKKLLLNKIIFKKGS